jgi:septal ring factor EnvC (AmiA/AmiB activator)
MTAPKKTPNALPVSFDQFRKNPVAAVAFCMLLAVSYLYMDLRSSNQQQIDECRKEMAELREEQKQSYRALKTADSALSAAITELRILNSMKKI